NASLSTDTENCLSAKYPLVELESNIKIDSTFLPTKNLVGIIKNLKESQAVFYKDKPIAYYYNKSQTIDFDSFEIISYSYDDLVIIENPWDIFSKNGIAIENDFKILTQGKTSQPIPDTVHSIGSEKIFIEEGAKLFNCSLNASDGYIYIGKNAEIMEGSLVRGPFALCENATLKMGSKIYGPTTIGPFSKVGGEVNNSVFFGFSNKAHDGFLGNSVIGEWCNLGADSNNSNLKNNYTEVKLWNYTRQSFIRTGLQFCGLMMGDHSKCGINTMFNTGTVVGVSANIFGSGFPRNFIPSFTWGGATGLTTFKIEKAAEVAKAVMARRAIDFSEIDAAILQHIYENTIQWRKA
ncbi:MAG TPA: putative sugar nucleotidyl transferase, partial [Flavobacteriaceae bacterium]|nr:putative sugar nucleotidyl transferase [Flavobacteriaceae bacterium]